MLLSLLLDIAPQKDLWHRRPAALRAFAYALFAVSDPALSARLHEGNPENPTQQEKPFTIALLQGTSGIRLRLTAQTAGSSQAMLQAVRLLSETPRITFAKTQATLTGCLLDCPPLAERTDCNALLQLPFASHVALRFPSPTAFKQNGLHLPLPVPSLLIRGWGRRWNLASPEMAFEDNLIAELADKVGLAQARIETCKPDLEVTQMVGFTGTIMLEAIKSQSWTAEERTAFTALTTFSRYCGTGQWTTQGMGLTLPTPP